MIHLLTYSLVAITLYSSVLLQLDTWFTIALNSSPLLNTTLLNALTKLNLNLVALLLATSLIIFLLKPKSLQTLFFLFFFFSVTSVVIAVFLKLVLQVFSLNVFVDYSLLTLNLFLVFSFNLFFSILTKRTSIEKKIVSKLSS